MGVHTPRVAPPAPARAGRPAPLAAGSALRLPAALARLAPPTPAGAGHFVPWAFPPGSPRMCAGGPQPPMQLACQTACSEFAAWGRKGNACQRACLPACHDHARLEARVDTPQHAQTAQEPHLQRLVHIVREFEGAVRDREIQAEILLVGLDLHGVADLRYRN